MIEMDFCCVEGRRLVYPVSLPLAVGCELGMLVLKGKVDG